MRGSKGEGRGVLNHTTHLSVHKYASYGISDWQRTLLLQLPKNPCHIKKMKIRTSVIKPSSPSIFLCKLWGIKRPIGVDLDRWGIKTLLDSLLHVLNALDLHPCTKKIDREWNTRINSLYQTFLFLPIARTCTFDGFWIFNCHKYVKDLRLENSNYNIEKS